ncbi:arylsulfatase J-like isoform X2 [Odontomachus brunneus]|nr:arylsulfatase J-like isoform X2 [Odontomachus brunneus]
MQGYPLRAAEPRSIPLNNSLLPEYLRMLGYTTALVGKWHIGYHTNNHIPTRRGFDSFLGYYSGYIEYFTHKLIESGQSGYDIHRLIGNNHKIEYRYDYMTDIITAEAESIILSHNTLKPMYLQLSHLAPHSSTAKDLLEVRSWKETNDTFGYIKDINRRKYASVVTTLDESVGRVVDALKRAEMLDNSIIIFLSDNGAQTVGEVHRNYGSNYPLRGLKSSFFDGAVRSAACIYSPLIESRSRISTQLIHISDWLPTLYSAAGGDPSDLEGLDGVDQWSAIKHAGNSKRQSLLINIDEQIDSEAALVGQYKLVTDRSIFSEYYGYTGNDPSYPKYNETQVLTSPAASAIASISPKLNADKLKQLRKEGMVICQNDKFSNCMNRTCLFDIYEDPCEITDLSSKYPEVVKRLSTFIDSYKLVMMKQTNMPVDPTGFPHNFNDTWMPWLPEGDLPAKCILPSCVMTKQ